MEDSKGSLSKVKEDIKAKQVAVIKAAVKETFVQIELLEKGKNDIQNRIKILKHDLFDLKDGRLDRVVERQGMNDEAKTISAFAVTKIEGQSQVSPWYIDYDMKVLVEGGVIEIKVNNSLVKMHASGSYRLADGSIKYL